MDPLFKRLKFLFCCTGHYDLFQIKAEMEKLIVQSISEKEKEKKERNNSAIDRSYFNYIL